MRRQTQHRPPPRFKVNPLADQTTALSLNSNLKSYRPKSSEMESMGNRFLQYYRDTYGSGSDGHVKHAGKMTLLPGKMSGFGVDALMRQMKHIYLSARRQWKKNLKKGGQQRGMWNDPTVRIVMLLVILYMRLANLRQQQQSTLKKGLAADALLPALYAGLLVLMSNLEHRRPDMKFLWKFLRAQAYRRLFQASLSMFVNRKHGGGGGSSSGEEEEEEEEGRENPLLDTLLSTVKQQVMVQMLNTLLRPLVSGEGSTSRSKSPSTSSASRAAAKVAKATLNRLPGVATRAIRHLSMIEILIAISIIVTFSGLAGVVYNRRYIDSKVSLAKIEMNLLEQALLLFKAEHHRYPVTYAEAMAEYGQHLSTRDPWGNEYIYVPHCDWANIVQALQSVGRSGATAPRQNQQQEQQQRVSNSLTMSSRDVQYWARCLAELARVLEQIPGDLVSIWDLLLMSDEGAFIACASTSEFIVSGQDADSRATPAAVFSGSNAQREKRIKRLAFLIKQARDKAVCNILAW